MGKSSLVIFDHVGLSKKSDSELTWREPEKRSHGKADGPVAVFNLGGIGADKLVRDIQLSSGMFKQRGNILLAVEKKWTQNCFHF